MFDLITIGDTTLDVFHEIDEATLSCDINKDACLLCLNYADKIPVRAVYKIPAVGNAPNVAVGGARLGLKTALYTVLGNDDLATESKALLVKEGVAPDYIRFDKRHATNYTSVLLFRGERTILRYYEDREYSLPRLKKTTWMYFSDLAPDHGVLQKQILAEVKKNKIKLGYNPGTYQLRAGLKKMISILKVTEVLFVNKQEAQLLLGEIYDMHELLRQLHKLGPAIVVITDAEKGSYAFDGERAWFQKSLKVPLRERTGAGDSYATGVIAALIKNRDIPTALMWGATNAASVVQFIGAQKGLLKQRALQKMVKEYALNPAKEIKMSLV